MTCCCNWFGIPSTFQDRSRVNTVSVKSQMRPLEGLITDAGLVRYHRLMEDDSALVSNIESIKSHTGLSPIKERRSRDLAFYCNAYNMWSMYLALQKLKQSGGKWKGNLSFVAKAQFFRFTSITVAGKKTNLYNLENEVIRKFGDARIHFAINCSSMSCPPLPKFLFDGDSLEAQFEEQSHRFINGHGVIADSSKTSFSLNPIFKWYKKDFDASSYGSILSFINHYIKNKISENAKVSYYTYDWHVNWDKSD